MSLKSELKKASFLAVPAFKIGGTSKEWDTISVPVKAISWTALKKICEKELLKNIGFKAYDLFVTILELEKEGNDELKARETERPQIAVPVLSLQRVCRQRNAEWANKAGVKNMDRIEMWYFIKKVVSVVVGIFLIAYVLVALLNAVHK